MYFKAPLIGTKYERREQTFMEIAAALDLSSLTTAAEEHVSEV